MAYDGLTVMSVVGELDRKILGAKIDKVYQPERDEIFLKVRSGSENFKLVLSVSSSNARVFLAKEYEKQNPKKAPVFCMTLRKHIQGGVITDIEQVGFERIIKITVESYDELRSKTKKDLYIEIMGKHSNIILVNRDENRIIDSIKRVPLSVSRVRQVLPGGEYNLPPKQEKVSPISVANGRDLQVLLDRLKRSDDTIYKAITKNILGFSDQSSREIVFRCGLEFDMRASSIGSAEYERLVLEIKNALCGISNGDEVPSMIIDEKRDKMIDFSAINPTRYSDMEIITGEISDIIEDFYSKKEKKDRIHQRTQVLRKSLGTKLERLSNKIKKQERELRESERAEIYRIKGELITSYIYMIEKGMDSVEVLNFYDNKNIKIDLNPNLTPSENAQKYFKKYNKLKTANEELSEMLISEREEEEYLRNTLFSIENCEDLEELKEIREELMREGYIRTYKMPKRNIKPESKYLKFISSAGNQILVGKNNRQNDYLTLRLADNEDIWLHTKDIPGSHVIIKCAGKEVGDDELFEAAVLAAYYSKARQSSNVAVDYTQKKNVKKPSKARPGMVIYEKNKTLYVTPTDENKARIKSYSEN